VDTIEVTGAAPLVDTTSTQLGAVVNERAVSQLPLAQRDAYHYCSFSPACSRSWVWTGSMGVIALAVVSVNGGRGRDNNYTVNGGDGNDPVCKSSGDPALPGRYR